jgi:hypothetical protein
MTSSTSREADVGDMSKMTNQEFWAEVGKLLERAEPGQFADYVTDEAECRDPGLGRIRRQRREVFAMANQRALAAGLDPLELGGPAELTPAEQQAVDELGAAYVARLREVAREWSR